MSNGTPEIDPRTGVETTGHEWDGIKELNTPAPRWWLMTWLVTCIWGFGYMFFYPAWPTLSGDGERGGTVGSLEWTQYKELSESQGEIRARKAAYLGRFDAASFDEIMTNDELYAFAVAGGKSAFKDNCATCHGTGGAGASGYPNLNDDDWLWGGDKDSIYHTIKYGIRSPHDETRFSEMPAFDEMLAPDEVRKIASYVVAMKDGVADHAGKQLFDDNCSTCHMESGEGMRELGAPNLVDAIWFYGSGEGEIASQIRNPKHGMMPAWTDRLDDSTIRLLTVYVHSLGGGE